MTQQNETFIHIAPKVTVGVGCPGKCDWSGWVEFIEPTTNRVTGGTQMCKTCGMMAISQKATEKIAQAVHLLAPSQPKRPVAFRVPRADPSTAGEMYGVEWRIFQDEEAARDEAEALGVEYQGLYVRDGT